MTEPRHYQGLIVQPDCGFCPLRLRTKVLPEGPIPAKLCFVGETPGETEERDGHGFIGPSGHLLWMLAAAYGIKREEVWVTNAALCYCPKDGIRLTTGVVLKQPEVKDMAVDACRRRLIGELLTVTEGNPQAVVVPMGNKALRALRSSSHKHDAKKAKIYAYRGSRMDLDLNELWAEVNDQWRRSVI